MYCRWNNWLHSAETWHRNNKKLGRVLAVLFSSRVILYNGFFLSLFNTVNISHCALSFSYFTCIREHIWRVRSGEGREEKEGEEGEGSMHEYSSHTYSKRVRPGHKAKIQDT